MTVDREWQRRALRDQLQRLAAPGDQALADYPDGCAKADELALDFHHSYTAYTSNFANEISPAALEALRTLDACLDRMSGHDNAHLWTDDAVRQHPAWSEVRRLAKRAL